MQLGTPAIEKLQEALEGIKAHLGTPETPSGTESRPLVVTSSQVTGLLAFAWRGPVVAPRTTAGVVAATVIFMLLERRDLRDRLIGLIGQGQATTTKAFDEAGTRVSRQLLMQSLGSQYVLGLRATNCTTGETIAGEQALAARKEDVLSTLSQFATRLRTRVGESLATVEKHSTPLEQATTPSLEALQAHSAGWEGVHNRQGG